MNRRTACFSALVLIALTTSRAGSADKKDPLNIEGGVLDEIHLKVATISAGVPIVIRRFSTESVDLGTGGEDAKNEKRSDATRTMVKAAPDLLIESFKATVLEAKAFGEVLPPDSATVPDGALVIEGSFTKIDPGSKAKRYWASFGAGKSGVQVTGTVKDATGKVLAEFKHLKNSGIGLMGGDYVKFLTDDTRDIGIDLAHFLATWSAGGNLRRD